MTDSPRRVRFAVVPAAVTLAGGAALVVGGWFTVNLAAYVWGLVLATVGAAAVLFLALPAVRGLLRAAMCVLLAVAVVGLGLWLPQRSLAGEFTGSNIRWSIPAAGELAVAVYDGNVVLAGPTSARVVALTDGEVLGTIRAGRGDTFSVADDRLLVVADHSATLHDRRGRSVWPSPVRADRGVAAAAGVTVVEAGDSASAVADDGSVRWTRTVDAKRATHQRFPNVAELPFDNINLETGPPVLPRLAALPVPASIDWEFLDPATGAVERRAPGDHAGVVDGRAVTSSLVDGRCQVSLDGAANTVACTYGKPWGYGTALFFENGANASVIAGDRDPVYLENATLTERRRLTVSPTGMASRQGRLVRGYPTLRSVNDWQFVAESESATVYAGNGAVVVLAALRRTNPFDPRAGFVPTAASPDQDYRVTVLDQRNGDVAGEVRAHDVASIDLVGPGSALVVADDKAMLVTGPGLP